MKPAIKYLLCLLPLIAGAGAALWGTLHDPHLPVIQVRLDVASLALLVGGLLSLGLGTFTLARQRVRVRLARVQARTREEVYREQRQFLQRLDHQLKNPLSTIKAGLALLMTEIGDAPGGPAPAQAPNPLQEIVERIDLQVQRLVGLISDLRKLSEIEVRPLECSQVNVAELLENLYQDFSSDPCAGQRDIHLLVPRTPFQLSHIQADEDLIYLALQNVLENAAKYTASTDSIEIRAFEDRHDVVIEIADSGMGIPEEELEHIWSNLFRARNARGIPGSGLGLPIVKTIVQRHAGALDVRSQLGVGSVFTLRFPKQM